MDLKVIALSVGVVVAIAVGVRAARAAAGDDPAAVPDADDLTAAHAGFLPESLRAPVRP